MEDYPLCESDGHGMRTVEGGVCRASSQSIVMTNWILEVQKINPSAHAIALIALVSMLGMIVGSIRVKKIGLGNAAVLFAGIAVGAVTTPIDHRTLEFVKELGLVFFVFCIGLSLGPGFFASLRKSGVALNSLAVGVVVLGGVMAVVMGWAMGIDRVAVLGLFAGATTNTPSLGAAQQTLATLEGVTGERAALPALAYAVSYPSAIAGILGTILLLKLMFRVDALALAKMSAQLNSGNAEVIARRTLVVENVKLDGVKIGEIPGFKWLGVLVSRIRRKDTTEVEVARQDMEIHTGDSILVVGPDKRLDDCERIVGSVSSENLIDAPGSVKFMKVAVTSKGALGKTAEQLGLEREFGVTMTRIARTGIEMAAVGNLALQFGDQVTLVGSEEGLKNAEKRLGNSLKALNETHFVPLFAGIMLGVLLGMYPFGLAWMPQPVRLGLAGGPLIVALIVGRIGRMGPLVWHMPGNANAALKDLGITLFFASVGLMAGPTFFKTVMSQAGLVWMGAGICITVVPLLIVGLVAMGIMKMNFVTVSGMLAGSMTDPPALAFANSLCGSEAPTVAYATVYPMTTMMRIITVQVLAVMMLAA